MTTIRVTEEHIAHGTPQRCALCPVALAIQAKLRAGFVAYVGQADVIVCDVRQNNELAGSVVRPFSRDVVGRIADYDAGRGMEPFEFSLNIPAHMLRE